METRIPRPTPNSTPLGTVGRWTGERYYKII